MSLFSSKKLKYGIPFLVFMVGGSFGLREFTQLRYKYRRVSSVDEKAELKRVGKPMKDPSETTLEAAYEKLDRSTLDQWDNKRIPRPAGW